MTKKKYQAPAIRCIHAGHETPLLVASPLFPTISLPESDKPQTGISGAKQYKQYDFEEEEEEEDIPWSYSLW